MKPTLIILLSLFPLFLSGQIISADSALALMKNWYQYEYDNIDSAVLEEIPDFTAFLATLFITMSSAIMDGNMM